MDPTTFSPAAGLAGGALIGLASAALLLANGKVAGISGILGESLSSSGRELHWRIAFLLGLPLGAWAAARATGNAMGFEVASDPLLLVTGGVLVGVGTQIGGGCTSGHGVCGIARGSRRSIVATVCFMAAGAVTVFVARHVVGGRSMKATTALLCGLLFGAGLAVSGMTNPAKVQGFLDVLGHWDPTLAFVMGGALAVSAIGVAVARGRDRSWLGEVFAIPTGRDLDAKLIGGSTLFGVGWGLVGLCPGPALANLSRGSSEVAIFVAAMVAGVVGYRLLTPAPDAVAAEPTTPS